MTQKAIVRAGVPVHNPWLYRVCPFMVGDPMAFIELPDGGRTLIIRDIEMDRARKANVADRVQSPQEFFNNGSMPPDRETATAQATAECLKRAGVSEVWTDRALPMIFTDAIERAGVTVKCDVEMGVRERRMKSEREVQALRTSQRLTEQAVQYACETIARAHPGARGLLQHDGADLTSERMIALINIWLLERGMSVSNSIVAGGADGGDCHNRGSGPLRTGQPVIVDVFPQDPRSQYFGDCTRTVVHGDIPDELAKMHAAVLEAKRDAIAATKVGATAEAVHHATLAALKKHGYERALPPENAPKDFVSLQHGTGHGVGLDVHEPPLIDEGGPELLPGECLTIEPGLYHVSLGGVRVEDMVIVRENGCDNLNSIPEGLTWA